jgi:hypothetical protein
VKHRPARTRKEEVGTFAILAPAETTRYKDGAMSPEATAVKKKGADINVLRCLNPECGGMLAYEVSSDNILYVDLAWTARRDGETRYFPCPKCNGRNIVEEMIRDTGGAVRHQVTRFEPGK